MKVEEEVKIEKKNIDDETTNDESRTAAESQ